MLSIYVPSFQYEKNTILNQIKLSLPKGQTLALLGENGSGKSTLLHILFGKLYAPNAVVEWRQRTLPSAKEMLIPGHPFMKLVTQENSLDPHVSLKEALQRFLPRLNPKQDRDRTSFLLDFFHLNEIENKQVKTLSGGQKQRLALAQSLAVIPEVLLLDEPFSQIGNPLRMALQKRLFQYLKAQGITCVFTTHHAQEVLSFSNKVAILKKGKLVQEGNTQDVYNTPNSFYAASFFSACSLLKINGQELLLYAHQLKQTTEKTSLKVCVETAYFQGTHFLIKAHLIGLETAVFFYHPNALDANTICYLELNN